MKQRLGKFQLALLIAWKMQHAHRGKMLASGIGVAAGFLLSMAQIGLMMGWIDTCTLMIQRADVDLWVVGVKSPAFEYGSPIPRQRLYQALSVEGVAEAYPLFMAWTIWSRDDGRKVNVELVGLDKELVGGPVKMLEGILSSVLDDRKVVVDSKYLELLGVTGLGQRFEMLGRRAEVAGICEGVRTFTASPFIFTSIDDAIQYDKRYRHDEITYVLVKCDEGVAIAEVARRLREQLPSVEVLTSSEFRWRTGRYWMIGTGIGFTVVMTAILGLIIGALVISQTLFSLLQDHRPHYATMLALGFEVKLLGKIVFCQAFFLWWIGVVLGGIAFMGISYVAEFSPVPLRMPPAVLVLLLLSQIASSFFAGWWVLRKLRKIDPVTVFSA
jgi:putative ABC transport system permease protein